MNAKQRAAEAALQYVASHMVVGLGTGSTAEFFIRALGARLSGGTLTGIRGVATSVRSEQLAREFNIPIVALADAAPDVTVDGADEVDPHLDLIKGLGGALLREKMVAQASKKLVIIADASKAVARLGTKSPLPVEVVQFSHEVHVPLLRSLGGAPTLRITSAGRPYVTDNGNFIYDVKFDGIDRPSEILKSLRAQAGIVDCGLFLGLASLVLIADEQRVEVRNRSGK